MLLARTLGVLILAATTAACGGGGGGTPSGPSGGTSGGGTSGGGTGGGGTGGATSSATITIGANGVAYGRQWWCRLANPSGSELR